MAKEIFSRHTLMFTDYILTIYPRLKVEMARREQTIVDAAFTRKDDAIRELGQVGKLSVRPTSDPTGRSATQLLDDHKLMQMELHVNGVEEVLRFCSPEEYAFIEKYFWQNTRGHTIEEKRIRRELCIRVAVVLGLPMEG